MITAVGPAFSGDSATVNSGAVLELGQDQVSLTLNNSAVGVVDAVPNAYPYNQDFYAPDGKPVVALLGAAENLDYTRYGYWTVPTDVNPYYDQAAGVWMGGYATPPSEIPTMGSATYTGRVVGLASSYPSCGCDDFWDFTGDVQMSANFGSRAISGSMTNLRLTDWFSEYGEGPPFSVGFDATLDPGKNIFTGMTRMLDGLAGADPYPLFPVPADATGSISGRFFGPSAQEVGAVWTLSDGVHRLMGSFSASRNGQ